jgi:hypothetical protein
VPTLTQPATTSSLSAPEPSTNKSVVHPFWHPGQAAPCAPRNSLTSWLSALYRGGGTIMFRQQGLCPVYALRDRLVRGLFEAKIGDERSFARAPYLNWHEANQMQSAGMVIGGHSHQHKPLSGLSDGELHSDLSTCWRLLRERLQAQSRWPFCYLYGQTDSFDDRTIATLKQLGFACSFSTEVGANSPGMDSFVLRRIDCRDALK